ncbi:hypothetical protein KFE25_006156 [Diacronema lutheri]|uniref:PIH1 domain-containing protein 1 n=1 Tax=Diacronema lutheri TaxID=2081491 RepID=A0A8J6CG22_DIALT|nr:hypothetical protein KFE25_006156 [Diacronema lutheri]
MAPHGDYAKWEKIDVSDDEDDIRTKKAARMREDMTPKEQHRIAECMQQPQFQALLAEYQDEISDPANREEQERYLQQVERESREGAAQPAVAGMPPSMPPPGQQLIKPTAGFVVKSWMKEGGRKVFINVTHHEDIAPATSSRTTAPNGRSGEAWNLPYIMSPQAKAEKDRSGADVTVYDACFHPEVLSRASDSAAWKDMVARTAFEGVQKLHKIELASEWKLPKLKYFGNFGLGPSMLTHNKAAHDKQAHTQARADGARREGPDGPAKASRGAEAAKSVAAPLAPPAETARAAQSWEAVPERAPDGAPEPVAAPVPRSVQADAPAVPPVACEPAPAKRAPATPEAKLLHSSSGGAQLVNGWGDQRLRAAHTRAETLTVVISLPALSSSKGIDLGFDGGALVLADESGTYALRYALPYAVDDAATVAKWDKGKRELRISMPVVPREPKAAAQHAPSEAEGCAEREEAEQRLAEEKAAQATKVAEAEARAAEARADAERADEARQATLRSAAHAALADDPPSASPTALAVPGASACGAAGVQVVSSACAGSSASATQPAAGEADGERADSAGLVAAREVVTDVSPDEEARPATPVAAAAQYEWRQNEHNVTMVIDVEGARADSAQLCARPLELDVQFRSADGKHSFSVELAHAIDPEQSRAQVCAECVLVILRKAQLGKWDSFEAKDKHLLASLSPLRTREAAVAEPPAKAETPSASAPTTAPPAPSEAAPIAACVDSGAAEEPNAEPAPLEHRSDAAPSRADAAKGEPVSPSPTIPKAAFAADIAPAAHMSPSAAAFAVGDVPPTLPVARTPKLPPVARPAAALLFELD